MNSRKKCLSFILGMAIIFVIFQSCVYAENEDYLDPYSNFTSQISSDFSKYLYSDDISIAIDGQYFEFDVKPVVNNGRTLVPLRGIFEELGAQVNWDNKTKTINAYKGNLNLSLKINDSYATVNGKKIKLDVPAKILDARTVVPTRFVAESMGSVVGWVPETKTVVITSDDKPITIVDSNLEQAIRKKIYKPNGKILKSDVEKIQVLSVKGENIKDLKGMENLKNLIYLDLSSNYIKDISSLKDLEFIIVLLLNDNRISDVTDISNIKNLMTLDISSNPVENAEQLTNMRLLKYLGLWRILWTSESFNEISVIEKDANKIISEVIKPDMTDLEKELALHDYIITHARYDEDNYKKGIENVPIESHKAYGILIKGVGVCDGYSEAMQILLDKVGIDSKIVYGDGFGMGDWEGHAWNMVKIDGQYYHVDLTYNDPSMEDRTNVLYHTYFNLSDKQMEATHKWEKRFYPACTKDSASFNNDIYEDRNVVFTDEFIYSIKEDGIYKIKPNTDSYTKLTDSKAYNINLDGEYLYYINASDNSRIYKIKIDGTDESRITDGSAQFIKVKDSFIYYIGDKKLCRISLDGRDKIILNDNDLTTYFSIIDNYIFLRAFDWDNGAKLYRMDLDGNGKITVSGGNITGFEMSGDGHEIGYYDKRYETLIDGWIYYINDSDDNSLYKVDYNGNSNTKLNDDDCSDIEVVGEFIYYKIGNEYYKIRNDGTGKQYVQ